MANEIVYSKAEIESILNERKYGLSVSETCRNHKINRTRYYRFKKDDDNKTGEFSSQQPIMNKNKISRDSPNYIRIEDYLESELHRGIILESLLRIYNVDDLFSTKILDESCLSLKHKRQSEKALFKEIIHLLTLDIDYLENELNTHGKKYTRTSLDKNLNYLTQTKNFILENEYNIIQILKTKEDIIHTSKSRLDLDLGWFQFMNNKKYLNYIDLLFQESKFGKQSQDIPIKHYLLKYIQKPLVKYALEYSNNLLSEYNFQKISLEIDLTLPKETQKRILDRTLDEIYSQNIQFNYFQFIDNDLLKYITDDKVFKSIEKGKRHYNDKTMRIADIFYIYDSIQAGMTYANCADSLVPEKLNSESLGSIHFLYKKINTFMEIFKQKYTNV